jgi:hypothetical protein
MEVSKPELVAIQDAVVKVDVTVIELTELHLSLIGGGLGDISLG